MTGFATDTTIDTVIVHLPDERKLRITLTSDGVNNDEPTVEAELDGEYLAISHEHTVLIDGVYEQEG